jgi:uracil-DNA glycosylase
MSRPELPIAREFEAALAWWHAAGVDCDYVDDATAWLAETPIGAPAGNAKTASAPRAGSSPAPGQSSESLTARAAPVASSPAPATLRRDLLGESPPQDLAAFHEWWMTAPGIDTARAFPRIAPRGRVGAALMVLVPQPEEADHDQLLSGPQGRLLTNILTAMGLDMSAVYIASALPCHTPMADLATLAAGGMDAVTAHHIGLVQPARVIAFGTGLAPMLGANSPDHPLREINYAGGKVPVIASETLDSLMEMPRLKARFWRRWTEWSPSH